MPTMKYFGCFCLIAPKSACLSGGGGRHIAAGGGKGNRFEVLEGSRQAQTGRSLPEKKRRTTLLGGVKGHNMAWQGKRRGRTQARLRPGYIGAGKPGLSAVGR